MDVNRDEVRRQLREIDHESTRELPRFRESLKRIFDQDSGVSDEAKAGLLGVPSRRTFFTVGGAAVLGSAVMVGCSTAKKKQLTQTGTTETTAAVTTTTAPGSEETDAILLRTAVHRAPGRGRLHPGVGLGSRHHRLGLRRVSTCSRTSTSSTRTPSPRWPGVPASSRTRRRTRSLRSPSRRPPAGGH
jgi:hypothetical protein